LVAIALALGLLTARALGVRSEGPGEELAGSARIIDGDTIAIGNTRIRLEGIDAPETGQTCGRRPFGTWPCGAAARVALARRIDGKPVRCQPRGRDRYQRTLAQCFLNGHDLNAWMVRQGYAWAFVRYSRRYLAQEAAAKAEGLGIWQGEAVPAWEFRARRWRKAEPDAPAGCTIKGNVTSHGKIYHMPWSPWYARIHMATDKGKRWFCTEAEAEAAGWRPVGAR
jgi:endonuclease YncB( thermonuclease family)